MSVSRGKDGGAPRHWSSLTIAWGSVAWPFGSALGRWKMGAVFDVIFRIDEEIGVGLG